MSDGELVIAGRGLTKRFGRVVAVDDLSLEVRRGEVYGFLGLNGAGKTTTLRLLLGLIRPQRGEVELFGRQMRPGMSWPFERIGVALDTPAMYENLSIAENLDLRSRSMGLTSSAVTEALDLMSLGELASAQFRDLSAGLRQRVALAAALLHQPELLVLDEPLNALDPAGIRELRESIQRLSESRGITVLLSSHILAEVQRVATRIGIIHRGRMIDQLDQDALRARSRSFLEIKVSDSARAAWVLEERLGVHDYAVRVDDTVRVYERLDSPGALNASLIESGVIVSALTRRDTGLEEHFMKLTGGDS